MTGLDSWLSTAISARPDETALVDAPNRSTFSTGDARSLTWQEVDRSVDSLAAGLQANGVAVGDAVAMQLPNVVELPLVILACLRIGAVAVPFPVQHREHELRHGFGAANVRAFVTSPRDDRPDWIDVTAQICAEHAARQLLLGDETSDGHVTIADEGARPVAHAAASTDVATVCWTSGTTGTPKGVPRTHAMWQATSGFQVDELGLGPDERILCPFPLVNMGGIGGMLIPWLETGSMLVLHHPIDLPVFLGQLGSHAITYTVAPPPLLNMLLRNDALLEGVDMSSIRAITSGSAPLDPWMVAGWDERGIEIVNAFGSNEGASLLSTRATVPNPEERARYFPMPQRDGVAVRLVDLDSEEEIDTVGQPGELRFRGPNVFTGYLGSDGSEFDADGWYRTGDVFEYGASVDGDRLLRFIDRAKDIIIRGGMNVSAAEVEALLSTHDAVTECAVVGYPDPDLGERVGVFVVPADSATPTVDDLTTHLRTLGVASYKHPELVELIDPLPRNPVGKVVKPELRARLAQQIENPTRTDRT